MQASELLQRIASTLRQDVGPAVAAEYPKTQAFMAAVVLQKIGRELELADQHRAAEQADRSALRTALQAMLGAPPVMASSLSARLRSAVELVTSDGDAAALCHLIEVLYAARTLADEALCAGMLARVRATLRAQIDRRMEVAG